MDCVESGCWPHRDGADVEAHVNDRIAKILDNAVWPGARVIFSGNVTAL